MAVNYYGVGARVRIDAEFRDLDGALTDPTTITVTFWDPSGNATTSTSSWTNSSVGVYYLDLTTDEDGTWYYKWVGAGAVIAAPIRNGKFVVNADQA